MIYVSPDGPMIAIGCDERSPFMTVPKPVASILLGTEYRGCTFVSKTKVYL